MFVPLCYLVIAILALHPFADRGPAIADQLTVGKHLHQDQAPQSPQAPKTVTIQPRAGGSSPGAPEVIVSVDKTRVNVGETVRFTLSPADVVTDPKFSVTVDFGDGSRMPVSRPVVVHQYGAVGHYKVYASVVGPGSGGDDDKKTSSVRVPRVTLSVSPASPPAGSPVNFRAQITSSYPNLKYRFSFGDGSQTDWQATPDTTHPYPTAGTYLAYVDIGAEVNGRTTQLGGSERQPVVVALAPIGPVSLSANPAPAETGKPVTLNARVSSTPHNVRYRFRFGDGSLGNWQDSAQTTHVYSSSGRYPASVEIGVFVNQTVRPVASARRSVEVLPSARVAVSLNADPTAIRPGDAVTFTARADGDSGNLRYRFVYGDDSAATDWQTNAQVTHQYALAGSYPAYVEVARVSGGRPVALARSSTTNISVTDASVSASPSPTDTVIAATSPGASAGDESSSNASSQVAESLRRNWWKFLLALLLVLAAYRIWKWVAGPRAIVRAIADGGGADVAGGPEGLAIQSEVILNPNISLGQYLVYTEEANVVRNVRRDNG